MLQNHARSLGAEVVTNAVSQVTELATENNGVRKYKSLRKAFRTQIFPPTQVVPQQRTMEYESTKVKKRPNSNFPSNTTENNGV